MNKGDFTKEMVDAFLKHPDWVIMEQFIENHFSNSVNIDTIDISNPSTTVHAEVIARQKIDQDIKGLKKAFAVLREGGDKKKPTYE